MVAGTPALSGHRSMAADAQANIIRKIEVIEDHGHHGGAWKVAYADFMTAMMAFFLLMWILSSSDEQKLRGIAEYFTNATLPGGSGVLDGATLGPPGTLSASNGSTVARGSDRGKVDDPTPAQWEVQDTTPTADPEEKVRGSEIGVHHNPAGGAASEAYSAEVDPDSDGQAPAAGHSENAPSEADPTANADGTAVGMSDSERQDAETDATAAGAAAGIADAAREAAESSHAADVARFEKLQADIMQAMQDNPDLRPLQQNVIFEKTVEGLRIQIIDQEGQPMFASGRSEMVGGTKALIEKLGVSLAKLPNQIVISGHTDSVPFSNKSAYDNWDLSSDRANATRKALENSGVKKDRIIRVSGLADTDLLDPENPKAPTNRRISVLLQYEKPTPPLMAKPETTPMKKTAMADKPMKSETPVPAKQPEPMVKVEPAVEQIVLDEQVFIGLRSALR